MDWKNLSQAVGHVAPLLGSLLAGPGGAVAGQLVAAAMGVEHDPAKVMEALSKPNAAQILRRIEAENRHELLTLRMAHDEKLAQLQQLVTEGINITMRAEAKSENRFYSSWRPLFGYAVSLCFTAHMLTPLFLIWLHPERMAAFMQYTTASIVMWTIAFGVLGVTVYKRSEDKKLKMIGAQNVESVVKRINNLTKELHENVS